MPTAAQELGLSTDNQQEARAALSESTASPATAAEAAAAEQQAALDNFGDAQAALEEALEAFGEGEGEQNLFIVTLVESLIFIEYRYKYISRKLTEYLKFIHIYVRVDRYYRI